MLPFYIPLLIILLIIFLLLSAFFSASETSLMSSNKYRLRYLAKKGKKNANLMIEVVKKPDRLLGTLLLGNNFVNISASSIATLILIHYVGDKGVVYSSLIMTAMLVVFCEIIPKMYAAKDPLRLSFTLIRPITFFMRIFSPFVKFMVFFSNIFLRVIGMKKTEFKPSLSEDEIKMIISIGAEEGVVDKRLTEMLNNVFSIKSTFVREIMVPRGEICSLEVNSNFNQAAELISNTRYSRIPVFEENPDNIIGVIHSKDITKYYAKPDKFDLKNIMKKPFFVPNSARIGKLIQTFQKKRVHLAVVVDEYGGVEGLVTLEDIIEEIVGDIFDEHDEVDILIHKVKENEYIVDGGLQIKELNSELMLEIPYDIANTVAGFLLTVAGHIPKEHEIIMYKGIKFEVERKVRRKLDKIRVEIPTTMKNDLPVE